MQRNIRADAQVICCLLNPKPHLVKTKEAKVRHRPAFDVYMKDYGQLRGRKVATLIFHEDDTIV